MTAKIRQRFPAVEKVDEFPEIEISTKKHTGRNAGVFGIIGMCKVL